MINRLSQLTPRRPQGQLSFKSLAPALSVIALGILVSAILSYTLLLQANLHLHRLLQLQTANLAKALETQLTTRISALQHLAKRLEKPPSVTTQTQALGLTSYLNDYTGYYTVAWFDARLKRQHYIASHSVTAAQLSALQARYAHELQQALHTGNIWLSPPIRLAQTGEKGFMIALPFRAPHAAPGGMLLGILAAKALFALHMDEHDFSITVDEDKQPLYQFGTFIQATAAHWVVSTAFNRYGATWKITTRPSLLLIAALKSSLPLVSFILGTTISILFGLAIYLYQLSAWRAKALAAINSTLKNEIAERMHAEETKQKLEKAFLQGQKLQAIGTLAGGIAHDFNNFLYAIVGYTEMTRDDVPLNSVAYKNLGNVLHAARRGQELIARILAFSRRQQHELQPILVEETIQSVLQLLYPTIPSSVMIKSCFSLPSNYTILANQTQLHQVIVNIVTNAVDAMAGEGTISLTVDLIAMSDPLLEQFPDKLDGHYCRIVIKDNGHGMDQATLARMFEPFFTTKEVGRGTGLGLSTVHAIVKEHRGEILVESQLGQGATFTLLFPEFSS